MIDPKILVSEALRTHDKLARRLESTIDLQRKLPKRAARTTAYAALEGRIQRLTNLRDATYARYSRRKHR